MSTGTGPTPPRGANPSLPPARPRAVACDHRYTYREVDGETWEVCYLCGFAELFADGMVVKTTDEAESARLNRYWGYGNA